MTTPILSLPGSTTTKAMWAAILVAALGYFVDVFDIWLFVNFRVSSLAALGLGPEEVTSKGIWLANLQQAGFLVGGFLWGMLGDKMGRVSVMFGSILLYSTATLLNAFVTSVEQYAVLRFFAGLGLAGEIGAGITLIAETLPTGKRGYGTMLVCSIGVAGAVVSALVGKMLDWKTGYIVGGIAGFVILALRIAVHESGLFEATRGRTDVMRGSLRLLFRSPARAWRYLSCIFTGIPIYLTAGLFAAFAPEIASAVGISETVLVPDASLACSIGITAGDVLAGLISQWLGSRKKPILYCLIGGFALALAIAGGAPQTAHQYIWLVGGLGLCSGYWACLLTTTAEQFGTNLRATAATSVPNLVRGATILLTSAFAGLKPTWGVSGALTAITIAVYGLAIIGWYSIRESFTTDLHYFEE